jgi:hypothetical protein
MWWTTLLVLIALGGAGLAVAADRPQNPVQRPEITWRADRNAQAWMRLVAQDLGPFDAQVVQLSEAGRHVLGSLQGLDVESMNTAVASGDAAALQTEGAIGSLLALRAQAATAIEEWRLGPQTRDLVAQVSAATVSAQQVNASWRGLAADANRVAGLVDALLRHDGLVFRATTAGRQSQWDDALSFLQEAAGVLADATATRDRLAQVVNVDTLDDLLARYRSYDSALVALYAYVRDTGNQTGSDFEALKKDVDDAQAALPADTTVMSLIVSEVGGPTVTDALIAIEQAHGEILAALAAIKELSPS